MNSIYKRLIASFLCICIVISQTGCSSIVFTPERAIEELNDYAEKKTSEAITSLKERLFSAFSSQSNTEQDENEDSDSRPTIPMTGGNTSEDEIGGNNKHGIWGSLSQLLDSFWNVTIMKRTFEVQFAACEEDADVESLPNPIRLTGTDIITDVVWKKASLPVRPGYHFVGWMYPANPDDDPSYADDPQYRNIYTLRYQNATPSSLNWGDVITLYPFWLPDEPTMFWSTPGNDLNTDVPNNNDYRVIKKYSFYMNSYVESSSPFEHKYTITKNADSIVVEITCDCGYKVTNHEMCKETFIKYYYNSDYRNDIQAEDEEELKKLYSLFRLQNYAPNLIEFYTKCYQAIHPSSDANDENDWLSTFDNLESAFGEASDTFQELGISEFKLGANDEALIKDLINYCRENPDANTGRMGIDVLDPLYKESGVLGYSVFPDDPIYSNGSFQKAEIFTDFSRVLDKSSNALEYVAMALRLGDIVISMTDSTQNKDLISSTEAILRLCNIITNRIPADIITNYYSLMFDACIQSLEQLRKIKVEKEIYEELLEFIGDDEYLTNLFGCTSYELWQIVSNSDGISNINTLNSAAYIVYQLINSSDELSSMSSQYKYIIARAFCLKFEQELADYGVNPDSDKTSVMVYLEWVKDFKVTHCG